MAKRIDVFARKNLSDSYSEISNHLSQFLGKLFVQLVRGQPKWYGEQQMRKDIRNYNDARRMSGNNGPPYDPKMLVGAEYLCDLCDVGHWEEITDTARRSASVPGNQELVEHLDLAGVVKALNNIAINDRAITYRIADDSRQYPTCNEKILPFFNRFGDYRKETSHTRKAADSKVVQGLLTEICCSLADPDIRKAFREYFRDFDENSERLFDSLHEELKQLTEDIGLYLDDYTIGQNADVALDYRHLYKYTIVADEWAFQSKYRSFLTDDVMSRKGLFLFDTTATALMGIYENSKQRNVSESEGTVSKIMLQELTKYVDSPDKRVTIRSSFHDEDGIDFDCTWDNIQALLKEKPDEKIVVVTDDEHSEVYARQIIACGNPNHVVVYLNSSSTVKPAISRKQELPPGESAGEAVGAKEAEIEHLELPSKGALVYRGPTKNVPFRLGECIGSGAEGNIYESDLSTEDAIKIYKTGSLAADRRQKLEKMVDFYSNPSNKQANVLKKKAGKIICWPVKQVFYKEQPVGYEMRRVPPDGYTLSDFLTFLNTRSRPRSFPEVKRSSIIQICEQITRAFESLHKLKTNGKPVLMGDVNPKNIMVSYDEANGRWKVWLIDVDSYRFGSEPCAVAWREFYSPQIAKELSANNSSIGELPRNRNDELFSVAVLLFYVLMIGRFPYQSNEEIDYLEAIRQGRFIFAQGEAQAETDFMWLNLSEQLQRMFQQVFGGGENRKEPYPELQEWYTALSELRSDTQDAGRYSEELFPTSGPPSANDRFLNIPCPRCCNLFETTEEKRKQNPEELCPACKKARSDWQREIRSCHCRKCGKRFTISTWDDGNDGICPDCCPELEISGMEAFSESASFRDNLRQKVIAAVNNYLESEGADNDR